MEGVVMTMVMIGGVFSFIIMIGTIIRFGNILGWFDKKIVVKPDEEDLKKYEKLVVKTFKGKDSVGLNLSDLLSRKENLEVTKELTASLKRFAQVDSAKKEFYNYLKKKYIDNRYLVSSTQLKSDNDDMKILEKITFVLG